MSKIVAFCPSCNHNVEVDRLYVTEDKSLYLTHFRVGESSHTWKITEAEKDEINQAEDKRINALLLKIVSKRYPHLLPLFKLELGGAI